MSTYAARTFVALVSLGEGTAQAVSEVADVPRTRVYDAASELQNRGLVDVKRSSPKRYWAISTETAGRHLEQEYSHRVDVLTDALDALDTTSRITEQRGVWTVTGRDAVTDRVVEFISNADDEVVYVISVDNCSRPSDPDSQRLSIATSDGVRADSEKRVRTGDQFRLSPAPARPTPLTTLPPAARARP
ncbi:TrmB family transcriptional regulator [Halobellus ruber]|uniref:TrmB family transcriptional regulator n=1 Tax=Halobellus ruber TaxID=2761102 RepID=UPI0031B605E1